MDHSSAASGKLCVIWKSETMDARVEYNIFIVDLSRGDDDFGFPVSRGEDHFRLGNPTLQIDYGYTQNPASINSFCVMGKTLYMFEDGGKDLGVKVRIFKSVFCIDLSSIKSNIKLDRSSLLKVGEMAYPKLFPVSIPTPGGEKIVVFSSEFYTSCVFELYTPSSGVFEPLPSLKHSESHSESRYTIVTYGFIRSSVLLVEILYGGSFVLDFDSLDKGWVSFNPVPFSIFGYVVVENGRFYLSSGAVCDDELDFVRGKIEIPDYSSFVESPDPSGLSREPHSESAMALVSDDNERVTLVFLQMRGYIGRPPLYSDLIIDVCSADLNEYKARRFKPETQWEAETQSKVKTRIEKTLKISFVQEDMQEGWFVALLVSS